MSAKVAPTYLERMGFTKGTAYILGLILAGGGELQHTHNGAVEAIQAQLAEQTTAIALIQQSEAVNDKHLADLDRDLRALTRCFDRMSGGKAVASNP